MKRFIITLTVEVEAETMTEAQREAEGCQIMLDPEPTGDTKIVSVTEVK